jgi:endonuclease G
LVKAQGPTGLEVVGTGSGFLIAPFLLLTNHHVLPNEAVARISLAQFNYEVDLLGVEMTPDEWCIDPSLLFVTSPFEELDFTLVGLAPRGTIQAGAIHGTIPLRADSAKVGTGERISIIQHPSGRHKEVVLHESRVTEFMTDGLIRYTSDTMAGSSGAPVFNDQWDVVALHHRGVIKKDDQGNPIRQGGSYVVDANEGIRISAIIEYLRSDRIDAVSRAKYEAFLFP